MSDTNFTIGASFDKAQLDAAVAEGTAAIQKLPDSFNLAFANMSSSAKRAMAQISSDTQNAAANVSAQMRNAAAATVEYRAALQEVRAATRLASDGSVNQADALAVLAAAQDRAVAAAAQLATAQGAHAEAAGVDAAATDAAAVADERMQYAMAYGTARIASYAGGVGSLGYALGSVLGRMQSVAPLLAATFEVAAPIAFAAIVGEIVAKFQKWYDDTVLLKGQLSDLLASDYQTAAQAVSTHWQLIQRQIAEARSSGHADIAAQLLQEHIGEKPIKLDLKIKQADLDALDKVTPGIRTLINELQAPDQTLASASKHLGEINQQIYALQTADTGFLSPEEHERIERAKTALDGIFTTLQNMRSLAASDVQEGFDAAVKQQVETMKRAGEAAKTEREKETREGDEAMRASAEGWRQFDQVLKATAEATAKAADEGLREAKALQEQIAAADRATVSMGKYRDELDQKRRKELAGDLGLIPPKQQKLPPAPFDAQVIAKGIQSIGESFSRAMDGVMMGTQRMSVAWRRMAAEIVAGWASAMVQVAAKHLAMEVTTTAQHAAAKETQVGIDASAAAQSNAIDMTASLKEIAHSAGVAAAKAWKAVVGIPVVGPVLAPPAAAASYAGVMAFGALASAEGGQWQVPINEQLTLLHRNEMVLPAPQADALRRTVADGGAGSVHLHFAPTVHAMDSRGVDEVLRAHGDRFAAAARRHLRAHGRA